MNGRVQAAEPVVGADPNQALPASVRPANTPSLSANGLSPLPAPPDGQPGVGANPEIALPRTVSPHGDHMPTPTRWKGGKMHTQSGETAQLYDGVPQAVQLYITCELPSCSNGHSDPYRQKHPGRDICHYIAEIPSSQIYLPGSSTTDISTWIFHSLFWLDFTAKIQPKKRMEDLHEMRTGAGGG